jgi:ankyrin repeat protein
MKRRILMTKPLTFASIALACMFAPALAAQTSSASAGKIDFGREVLPIFRQNCFACHGPSQQMGRLRLDERRSALPNRVGANGVPIIPGNSAASRLYLQITKPPNGVLMPPAGPLSSSQIETIRLWIDQGADWPDEFDGETRPPAPDPFSTRMMEALRKGEHEVFIRTLREHPEVVNHPGSRGYTPLMYAGLYGDANSVRLLLERGADPNVRNSANATPLMYAVDDAAKTRLLLEHDADPNLRSDEEQTPLTITAGNRNPSAVVRLLIDHGADIKADGSAALLKAASSGDVDSIELLLERGAEPQPLVLAQAVFSGCSRCVSILLPAKGQNLGLALTAAILTGDVTTANFLFDRGAKPGPNLLSVIALKPELPGADFLKTLLSHSADINADNGALGTVLDLARRQGRTSLVEFLEAAGAKSKINFAPPPAAVSPAASITAAVERSLPPLQHADEVFLRKAGCISCHNNSLTAMTMRVARQNKLPVNEQIAQTQIQRMIAFLDSNREQALQGLSLPGLGDTVGYILLGLAAADYPADFTTDSWARSLKQLQESDGHWRSHGPRPPIESSEIQATAVAMRCLQVYAPPSRRTEYQKSVQLALRWLESSKPVTNEDRVFELLGLYWGGANRKLIKNAAAGLLASQHADGGWSQLTTLSSDAYATGEALTALRESGAVTVSAAAYQKGIQFLMNSQLSDGSWYVRTRTLPAQPYFDSEFPHGRDQFISAAATNWAVMALAPAAR